MTALTTTHLCGYCIISAKQIGTNVTQSFTDGVRRSNIVIVTPNERVDEGAANLCIGKTSAIKVKK